SELMVGFGKFRNQEFVRMVTINSLLDEASIFSFFETLEAFASRKMLKITTT
ncbi:MAG: cysteine synthase, partial [Flavobacteriaceae bacterium]|nr:cysteine synthase [Flavobacteriaceae bacterium]